MSESRPTDPTPAPTLAQRLTAFRKAFSGVLATRDLLLLDEAVAALSPEPPPAPPTPPAFDAVMKLFKDWAVRVMLPSQFSHNDGLRFEQMARERFEQPPTEAR